MKVAQVNILSVTPVSSSMIEVTWSVSPSPDRDFVDYFAAAPATRGASFDGSGLPFANETQAMQGSASRGRAVPSSSFPGTYSARIALPNSYYAGLGTKLVPPALHVTYVSGGETYRGAGKVADEIPFRTLTYPSTRTGPQAYASKSDRVSSQQALLYASAYPSLVGVYAQKR